MKSWRPKISSEMFQKRAQLFRQIRSFFDERGFIEVDTPALSRDTVIDRYIEPIEVDLSQDHGKFWLQTSPEFSMKRILAGASGIDAIYQLSHSFRAGEAGAMHNPEFMMLEWYRNGDDYGQGIELLIEFAAEIFSVEQPARKISYRDLFLGACEIDPHTATEPELAARARSIAHAADWSEESTDRDGWLNLLFDELAVPAMNPLELTVVTDWPESQAALAKTRSVKFKNKNGGGNPPIRVAERFELYYRHVELANGYHELTDAEELLLRNQNINRLRQSDGRATLNEESGLSEAMRAGLPSCSGVAMGIDRVLMVLTGSESLHEVMPFPIDLA